MSIKFLPVSHFEREPKSTNPIWAINTADQSELRVAGEVLLPIPKTNGQGDPDTLRVPQSWLPFELTADVTRQRLLRASIFRKAVTNGLIGLIDEETAARLLRQDGAKEEMARLRAKRDHVRTAGAARSITDSKVSSITLADGSDPDDDDDGVNSTVVIDNNRQKRVKEKSVAELAMAGVEEEEPGVSVQLKMWVNQLNRGNDANAVIEIKARRKYKRAELVYLSRSLNAKFKTALSIVNRNLGGKVKKAV